MNSISRRSFIQKGAVVGSIITASGLVPRRFYAAEGTPQIRYRDLGKTGFEVSEIGFGAMNTRDEELIEAAVDAGINYIDTAHMYMNGVNEEVVGKAIQGKRDKVFLTTKVAETDLKAIPTMIETSLKRLQTDHVYLLLAHGLHETQWLVNEDLIKPLDDARRKGQARFVGYSTHKFPNDYLDATLKTKFWEAVTVSYNYQSPKEVTENIQKAREAGIAIIAMKSLMKGRGNTDMATESITPNQAALKWVLENEYVDVIIPGMTTFEQLAEDLPVMGMKLSSHEQRELRRFSETLKGNYCCGVLGCTGCKDKCPHGVQVHEINRCLGYAFGYGDLRLARENYENLSLSSRIDICSNCDECEVKCVNGLNLTENIMHARNLFA